jgi:hypothetical protein
MTIIIAGRQEIRGAILKKTSVLGVFDGTVGPI